MKIAIKIWVSIILLVILGLFVFPSPSITVVTVAPINATTLQDLTCTWSISGYTQYNVSWYNNSVLFNTTINASTITLSNSYTAKGETWTCSVVAENSTDQTFDQYNESTEIKNTAPSTPILLNSSGYDIGNSEPLTENSTYVFTISSSDPDPADAALITYDLTKISGNSYCTLAGTTVTCTPYLQPTGAVDRYKITVDDTYDGSLTFVNFNVSPINDAPNFTSYLANTLIYEGETLSYPFTVTDEENATASFYHVNFVSSPSTARLENYTSNYRDYTIRFVGDDTAGYSDVGNYSINVSVCDPDDTNHCTIQRFNLVVNSSNHPPNLSIIQNFTGRQNQNFSFIVNATDIDSGNILEFTISTLSCAYQNPWAISTINNSVNATGTVNVTLNNSHVLCPNVTVTVSDNMGGSSSQNVYFNITNEDDMPVISNFSLYGINTQSNTDIRNLAAYTYVQFYYMINGSDPDTPIDPLETLTYTDNSSSCIDCPILIIQNGLINMTFNESGNFSYEINLTDTYKNYTTAWMQISVLANILPYFNQTPGNLTINETDVLYYTINATDPEGTNVTFAANSSMLNITSISSQGIINHTYTCDDIGNYSIRISITDGLGAVNYSDIMLQVRNEPTSPILPDFGNITILEELLYYRNIASEVTDLDYICSKAGDSYTFVPVYIGGNLFMSSSGLISFVPDQNLDGIYRFNVTAIDSYGLNSSKEWNLTIANLTNTPSIVNITPYGIPLNTSWITVSALGASYTNVNASENMTIYFDHNSTDPDGDPLFFNWTVNGITVNYSRNYTRTFNFTDAGNYNITLSVSDNVSGTLAHRAAFTWNLTVDEKNRGPDLANPLVNFSNLSTTYRWSTYMTYSEGKIRFYDPDGDTLTYNNSPTTLLTIEYEGNDTIFTPLEEGTEYVVFTASDGYEIYYSNNVTINITGVPNTTVAAEQQTGTSTQVKKRTIYVPYIITEEKEIEKDVYLDILNPEPVVIYNNNTLRQTISLVNNGNKTLKGIWLSAITNSSTADISFSNNYLNELLRGEIKKTDIIIKDYKIYNNYEITITANVTSPAYKDKAVIYINALEKTRGNQSVSATKVTFAQDLLASNPECIELNEYLKKALQLMEDKDYEGAAKITDSVIQGCKYLVSQSRLKDEAPGKIYIDMQKILDIPHIKIISAVLLFLITVIAVLTIRQKRMNDVLENM